MSYEEDRRIPYIAKCACGKGYLRYYEIQMSNDWGQEKTDATPIEIYCDYCKNKYHVEYRGYDDIYFVPNGLNFPKEPVLERKYHLSVREEFIEKHSREELELMIADMKSHRYMSQLEYQKALFFAQEWVCRYRKKSLKPMIEWLESILVEYDTLKASYDEKNISRQKYFKKHRKCFEQLLEVEEISKKLVFERDYEEIERERKRAELEREKHKYDPFIAKVEYHNTYKKDFVGKVWDTLYIKKCIDEMHLNLEKTIVGDAKVIITKRYLCTCYICKKSYEFDSSDFVIDYDEDYYGYYPKVSCTKCHTISSFEAKTMEILNSLGITFAREVSFPGLIGNSGKPLRFDFALYKKKDTNGKPIYDVIIELQGPHHFSPGYYNEYGIFVTQEQDSDLQTNYLQQKDYDERKSDYCIHNDIHLEYIKYTYSSDYDRLERKLIKILREHNYNYYNKDNPLF